LVVHANVGRGQMDDKKLSQEELERQRSEQLPDREVMSTINPSIAPEPPIPLEDGPLMPTDPIPK
jgi:hypothetical protein